MEYLIVSTLPPQHEGAAELIGQLAETLPQAEVVYTQQMKISACLGCNSCWLKTPGRCPIHDDYEPLMLKFLQVKAVVFVCDTKLGFLSYQTKNLFDRILPLATMYLTIVDGQMRHIPRYHKNLAAAVLYTGQSDNAYLNRWLARAMLNLHGVSLGAYPFEEKGAAFDALARC